MQSRPTDRELDKKIREAKQALEAGCASFANPEKIVGELMEMEISDSKEVWTLIGELLSEISPKDYAGRRPPMRAYEATIRNKELLAFSWNSRKMGKRMYLKFALKEGRFYYVSLHASKFPEGIPSGHLYHLLSHDCSIHCYINHPLVPNKSS